MMLSETRMMHARRWSQLLKLLKDAYSTFFRVF